MPRKAYASDAGFDLRVLEDTLVPAGQGVDVRTGVAINVPPGWYGRIVGRSSALRKRGLLVIEGTIDSGFTGELYSYVYCPGTLDVLLKAGESVAQLLMLPVPEVTWELVDVLPDTERGENGFGSTGA